MLKRQLTILLIFCLIFLSLASSGQENISSQINTPLLQKYVDLAKQNYPKRQMFQASEIAAKSKIGIASASYLESINLSYFYRPDNSAIINASNPYSINGFQLGIYLNIGMFVRAPSLVKQAKQEYKAANAQTREYDILLETEVKQKYYEYLRWLNDLKIKSEAYIDNKSASDGLKYKFEKGEVSLDIYSKAKSMTTTSASEKLTSELNFLNAKTSLEALIGQKIEEVK